MKPPSVRHQVVDVPAIAGGRPVRESMLPFVRVIVDAQAEAAVTAVLRSGWISQGPVTERFEAAMAAYIGAPHAVAVSSCTAALHLLLRAAGVGPGDDVIVPAMTFPATANAVLHAGARPVLADVDRCTLALTPQTVAAAMTEHTRAVIAVHFAGEPCDVGSLAQAAGSRPLTMLEDAAHAIGASLDGAAAGCLGDGAAFSFYATKNLTTGDGGMAATRHEDWAARMRVERLHGIDVDASRRAGASYTHWEAITLGFKYNMTDIEAALGLAQVAHIDAAIERRRVLERRYRDALAGCDAVELLAGREGARGSAHLFVIRIVPRALRIDRDGVLKAMLAENIGVGVHFRALPAHRFFRAQGLLAEQAPVAMESSERVLSLPLDAALTEQEQDDVIAALLRILGYYRA
ncbi:MAG TPA: DegT/DnrJ/EryC1/StrS aminotransferase family protein [Candidatus Limnocylindrales bacterium]|nr:DegT/DnrJ/EryC1/StrS aminotransferase family protein [Candidatus Limnocylindrales bacterium]